MKDMDIVLQGSTELWFILGEGVQFICEEGEQAPIKCLGATMVYDSKFLSGVCKDEVDIQRR